MDGPSSGQIERHLGYISEKPLVLQSGYFTIRAGKTHSYAGISVQYRPLRFLFIGSIRITAGVYIGCAFHFEL